ncbi:MAG: type II toxin-antitoxin system VapC family toxin [Armatimonadota bacterium]|nr:type II toxin-antitoxin system VapC family toxin [bacterium]MDW8321204.1 type II toxin-antitoxin system VapC family toxin [Armatimonadota bacterium]
MSGSRVALDTNQAIAVLNDTGGAGQWIQSFAQVYLPVPVVAELLFGALNSRHHADNLQRVEQLVSRCQVLEVKASTAKVYAHIRLDLKRKGKPIPENDLWIAALCVEHSMPLATSDEHFRVVEGLQVVMR